MRHATWRVTLSRLDPTSPWVLDTRELSRRPGSERTVTRTAPALSDLGIAVIGVPAGSEVDLDVRLESVMEGVLVTGTATVQLRGECARCLGPIEDTTTVDVQELYVYEAKHPDPDEEQETRSLTDDLLDLEPLIRDAVVLALPFSPLCSDDCPGLCPDCGVRLADEPDHAHDEPIDPRWAGLQALADGGVAEHTAGAEDDSGRG